MRSLEISARVAGLSAGEAYSILCDFERYPEYSDAVRSVKIQTSPDGAMMSSWETNFRNGILRWSEIDVLDPAALSIAFQQTEGDIDLFLGHWKVKAAGDGAVIDFFAQFDMGMPSLSHILDPIAEQALRENIIAILQGLFGMQIEILDRPVSLSEQDQRPADAPNQLEA